MESYKEILDNLHDGIYFVDLNRRITYWNKAAEELTGFASDEVVGRSCADNILIHIDETGTLLCKSGCPLTASLKDGQYHETEVYLHHKHGHRIPVLVRVSPIRDKEGNIVGAAELFSDNSGRATMSARMRELEELALLDPLTRLANRRYVETTIENRLRETERYKWSTGILFMDIDHFKNVNDTYGHAAGDEVLKRVANTLLSNTRPFDLFGRWGGEEFIGVIRNIKIRQLLALAEKLRVLIEKTTLPTREATLWVTVSVGVTLLRPDDSVDGVVERADKLMYQSKKKGRNRVTSDGVDWPEPVAR